MAAKLGHGKINELNKLLIEYIENTDIPIVAEFAYKNNIRRQLLYENEILSDTTKRLINKKEAQLERQALGNTINTTFAIFSLKQLGWRDNKDMEISGDIGITVVDDIEKEQD